MKDIYSHWRELGDVVEAREIAPHTLELTTVSGRYILKIKHNECELRTALQLRHALRLGGVPAERPVESTSGRAFVARDGTLYCLFERLPGHTVDDDFEHVDCRIFGEAIALLHAGLDRADFAGIELREMSFSDNINALRSNTTNRVRGSVSKSGNGSIQTGIGSSIPD